MLDNKLVQIGLVFLAIYIVMQIMNKTVSQENMDSLITPVSLPNSNKTTMSSLTQSPPSTVINITTPTSSSLTSTPPVAANALITQELAGATSAASAVPVVTGSPSAAITGGNIPSPVSASQGTLMAAAPPSLTSAETVALSNQNVFAPEPTDLDSLFGKRSQLDPADLIPKNQDAELYGNFAPDPKLNQNFLQNRWSLGIDVSKPKRGFVNDLRGQPSAIPLAVISPFNQPTQSMDLYRKSLADIC